MRLRVLTAWELLEARAEAERCCEGPETLPLWYNACLLARAAGRRFSGGAAVLRRWSPERIEAETLRYQALAARCDPHPGQDPVKTEGMLERLRQMPEARLQWRVLRAFGVLPSEPRARRMRRADYLYCALHLLLDGEEQLERLCPDCRAEAAEEHCPVCGRHWESSDRFDEARFEALREGRA